MLKTTYVVISKQTNRYSFLTLDAKLISLQLRQVFTKAPIFYYFNSKHYISIKTNTFGYTIDIIFS